MSLWKRDTEVITRAEEVALSMAVNLYIEEIKKGQGTGPFLQYLLRIRTGGFPGDTGREALPGEGFRPH